MHAVSPRAFDCYQDSAQTDSMQGNIPCVRRAGELSNIMRLFSCKLKAGCVSRETLQGPSVFPFRTRRIVRCKSIVE